MESNNNMIRQSGLSPVGELLDEMFSCLEARQWLAAEICCRKIQETDPDNAYAYLGQLMIKMGAPKPDDLRNCEKSFENNDYFQKAYRFADAALKSRLESYLNDNRKLAAQRRHADDKKSKTLIGIVGLLLISALLILIAVLAEEDSGNGNTSAMRVTERTCQHRLSGTVCQDYDICELCGESVYDDSAHNYTNCTCTEASVCTRCGEVGREALGHLLERVIDAPPCILEVDRCTRCGEWPASIPHTYERNICTECGDMDMDPNTYGFYTAENSGKWIEVYGYSFGDDALTAYYITSGDGPDAMELQNGICYEYSYGSDLNPDYKLQSANSYTVVNNDTLNIDGSAWVINERAGREDCIVLKTMQGSNERWFVLADQIDWSKTEIIDDPDYSGYERYIFHFKQLALDELMARMAEQALSRTGEGLAELFEGL